jgi:hypothetical protein
MFLIRHPAKLFWRNRHRLDVSPRFRVAGGFAVLYAAIALVGFAVAAGVSGWKPLLPFVILSPLLVLYAAYDVSNRGRRLLPELAAPMGLAAAAPAIALTGGWEWDSAWALWAILQARAVPSILYVRARLRLERGARIDRRPSAWAHVAAVATVAWLWWIRLAPLLAVAALVALLARSIRGLSARRTPARAKQIGFAELAYGLVYAAAAALGFRVGP